MRGEIAVTLDADLQTRRKRFTRCSPPIAKVTTTLAASATCGVAMPGGAASKLLNRIREKTTRIKMTDQGCMPCAYSRAASSS